MDLRRAALILTLCTCACESSAPAAPSRRTPAASEWAGQRDEPSRDPPQPPASAARSWVLNVGDSFVDAWFRQNLTRRFRESGTRYVADGVTATYTTTWAYGPDLDAWLAKRPSLVILTLGANEVDMPAPEEHAAAVERLARKVTDAGAACVWVTPPLWKKDTGILQVIHDHCAPCLYFDSDAVLGGLRDGERQPDGIHPNSRGGARWSAAFWEWLQDHRDPRRAGWALVPYETRGS